MSRAVDVARYDLGGSGLDWVRRSLESGGALSAAFLAASDLGSGHVFTFLPPGLGDAACTSLADGGLFSSEPAAVAARIAVISALKSLGGDQVVIEGNRWSLKSPSVKASPGEVFVLGEEIYWWRFLDDGADELERFLHHVDSGYPTQVFLISGSVRPFAPLDRIGEERIGVLARQVRALLASAYDDESYVLWSPDGVRI